MLLSTSFCKHCRYLKMFSVKIILFTISQCTWNICVKNKYLPSADLWMIRSEKTYKEFKGKHTRRQDMGNLIFKYILNKSCILKIVNSSNVKFSLCSSSDFRSDKSMVLLIWSLRSSHQRCSVKKVFLEISQNSHENTCARVPFLIKLQEACNFI